MRLELSDNTMVVVIVFIIAVLAVLFAGEPDLHDKLLNLFD